MQEPEAFEPDIERGWIAGSLADELPDLRLLWVRVAGRARKSPRTVRRRLETLSDLVSAAYAVSLRQHPVAEAYRAFERQVGLDPNADRGPLELALVQRMHRGEFQPAGLPEDACLIATVETAVPVWALDGETVVGGLGVCTTHAGELLGRGPTARPTANGRLAVADATGPLAPLFSSSDSTLKPGRTTNSIVLYAIGVPDVSDLVVHEALWIAGALTLEPG